MSAAPAINTRPVRLALGETGFARLTNVSRETLDRLAAYVDLLSRWNERINLVGRNTMGDVWRRHILDAAQLYPLLSTQARVLVDLGSGAGLPGLVLAIMGVPEVHLVESDLRKAAFLREAMRVTGTTTTIHAGRIEKISGFPADVITARALAPLDQLIDLSEKFRTNRTLCLFLKGEAADDELAAARRRWTMTVERIPSRSNPAGFILKAKEFQRVMEG